MIITVAGFKGGIAKTTTAVHLACYFSTLPSKSVLLVDGDPNRSSLKWSQRGTLPFSVCDFEQAVTQATGIDYVIVDTQAHPDPEQLALLVNACNLLVLPTTPDALSVEALISTTNMLMQAPGRYAVAMVRCDLNKKRTIEQARAAIAGKGLHVFNTLIRRYTAYEKAALQGVPVYDARDANTQKLDPNRGIAWSDYQKLAKEVLNYAGTGT